MRFAAIVLLAAGSSAAGLTFLAAAEIPSAARHQNSLGMELVRVEPGSFNMGSDRGDFDERPVHRVRITEPFYLGRCEVTNAQYEQFDAAHRQWRGRHGFAGHDTDAVLFVRWTDAVQFCQWLSEREGLPYRLPTEAEWEYACRAGTTGTYSTGDELPPVFAKNVTQSWLPGSTRGNDQPVDLRVGGTPPNAWGLFDMHGNVEEWCSDWYGAYDQASQVDPVGHERGDFRVTRGGSHSTTLEYLRAANRSGTLPDDRSWLIGFRVALGKPPKTHPLPVAPSPLNAQRVRQEPPARLPEEPSGDVPYFAGPKTYVKIPAGSEGALFSKHNHCPALVECPNGDLLAIWYSCRTEPGRELAIVASRLRHGQTEWDEASPFWDAPDRNDHASALWCDERGRIYHFNGLSAAATWGNLALVLRTSDDNGASWSAARLIGPEHGLRHMPVETVFSTTKSVIVMPSDALTGGEGGTAVVLSRDGGKTWRDPGEGRAAPAFEAGGRGAWIAGIHGGVVELRDGRWLAFGRGNHLGDRMPQSISRDEGLTWTYAPSEFPPIGVGQRLVVTRLAEGPIFFASFAKEMELPVAAGRREKCSGLFAALSFDEGRTWPTRRLITDGQAAHQVDGGGNTGRFTMSPTTAEPRGYMSVCQSKNGVIHLISSKQHYAFNTAWLGEYSSSH